MTLRGRPASLPEAGFAGGEASIRCHSLQPLLACSADGAADGADGEDGAAAHGADGADGADGVDGAGADGAVQMVLQQILIVVDKMCARDKGRS